MKTLQPVDRKCHKLWENEKREVINVKLGEILVYFMNFYENRKVNIIQVFTKWKHNKSQLCVQFQRGVCFFSVLNFKFGC